MSDGSRTLTLSAVGGAVGEGRLRQLDALRVLTCLSVVAVHAIGGPYSADSVGLGVVDSLLHYSREIFFFVSALVLVRTYVPRLGPDGRLPDESAFRRRRLRLIGMPYLWWTTIYLLIWIWHVRNTIPLSGVLSDLPLRWLYLVGTGNGCYHMYFLLVTLQFAVVFPTLLRVLGRTQGRHDWLLAGSLVLQIGTLAVYHWVELPDDAWRGLIGDASLFAYQLWLVAGALAGLYLERMHAWLVKCRVLVLGAVPVAAGLLLWCYYSQLPTRGALGASSPLQPMMVVWTAVALGALYLAAVSLSRLTSPLAHAVFSYGAQLSFGVYLAHPMVLDAMLSLTKRIGLGTPSPWLSALLTVLTVAGSVLLCTGLHRTRLSLGLMGRPRLDQNVAPRLWRLWPYRRPRLNAAPTPMLVALALVMLLLSSDQSPVTGSVQPSPPVTVEADADLNPDLTGK